MEVEISPTNTLTNTSSQNHQMMHVCVCSSVLVERSLHEVNIESSHFDSHVSVRNAPLQNSSRTEKGASQNIALNSTRLFVNPAKSPLKKRPRCFALGEKENNYDSCSDLNSSFISSVSDSTYKPSEGTGTPSEGSQDEFTCDYDKEYALKITLKLMLRRPKMYMGIDPENLPILDFLAEESEIDKNSIFLVLRKIRLNESYEMLGDSFSYSASTVARIFNKCLPLMANYFKTFIFWPEKRITQSNIPSAFRANYAKVDTIIDCFEIEIEKPSNASHQALTWSEYKKCNTAKYQVSCCPDGFINFVSKGYGGRASDVTIINRSSFVDTLRPGSYVMADRGFKQIESLLAENQCSLIRPPSVASGVKMSKEEVQLTKVVASLRIHVERVIRRIRDYSFLGCHSRFHHNFSAHVDKAVIIACALSNIQAPIIK